MNNYENQFKSKEWRRFRFRSILVIAWAMLGIVVVFFGAYLLGVRPLSFVVGWASAMTYCWVDKILAARTAEAAKQLPRITKPDGSYPD